MASRREAEYQIGDNLLTEEQEVFYEKWVNLVDEEQDNASEEEQEHIVTYFENINHVHDLKEYMLRTCLPQVQ